MSKIPILKANHNSHATDTREEHIVPIISGDKSILSAAPKEGSDSPTDKETILNFINKLSIKDLISVEYCNELSGLPFDKDNAPLWIKDALLICFYVSAAEIPFIKDKETVVADANIQQGLPTPTPN